MTAGRCACETRGIALALFAACAMALPSIASAQPIVVGPYTFPDETPFADDAVFHPTPLSPTIPAYRWEPRPSGPEARYEWRLVGYSPRSGLTNLGTNSDGACPPAISVGRELLDFVFTDVPAVNGPGPDIVIFDARWSDDHYEVAVLARGGAMTEFRLIPPEDQVPTGADGPGIPGATSLWGVEIDLSHYRIFPGVEVGLVRVAGDDSTTPSPCAEADPVMAAVLHPPCACDDGDECTWDCDASGGCASTPHDPGTPCSVGVCDGAATPSCVECLEDAHCPGERPRCELATRSCVECLEDAECSDENECTADACSGGRCVHTAVPAGSPCSAGICAGEPDPACVACLEDAHCDDGLPCTIDECVDEQCGHRARERATPCDAGWCDGAPSEPRCVGCLSDADCGDEFLPFCTEAGECAECLGAADCPPDECASGAACVEGACVYAARPRGSSCSLGLCDGEEPRPRCLECFSDLRCDDANPCTEDTCEAGACVHISTCTDAGRAWPDASAPPPAEGGCGCRAARGNLAVPLALAALACLALATRRRAGASPRRGRR